MTQAIPPNCRCPQCGVALALPPARIGQPIVCPGCRQTVAPTALAPVYPNAAPMPLPPHLMGAAAPAPMSQLTGPLPPHLAQQAAAMQQPGPIAAPLAIDRTDDVGSRRYRKTAGGLGAMTLWIVLGALTVLGVGVLGLYVALSSPGPETAEEDASPTEPLTPPTRVASNAPTKRFPSNAQINLERVRLRIESVTFGAIQYQMGNGRNGSKPERIYLKVNILLRNDRTSPVAYRSWYDGAWTADGEPIEPTLTAADDDAQGFARSVLEGVRKIENHREGESNLRPGDETRDTIVFELPEDFEANPFDLNLDLPGDAVGSPGMVGIRILASAIRFE